MSTLAELLPAIPAASSAAAEHDVFYLDMESDPAAARPDLARV
jgi:hypothetical protein